MLYLIDSLKFLLNFLLDFMFQEVEMLVILTKMGMVSWMMLIIVLWYVILTNSAQVEMEEGMHARMTLMGMVFQI